MNSRDISTKAFVLAGGKGTRSENPKIPKILQVVGPGVTILDLLFETLAKSRVRDVVFLLGHHENLVVEAIEKKQKQYAQLVISYQVDEPGIEGTSIALFYGIQKSKDSEINLLLLGDTAINAPLDLYIDEWLDSSAPLGLAIHPNLHPQDSDCLEFENQENYGKFKPKNLLSDDSSKSSWPVTGLAIFSKNLSKAFKPKTGDASHDLALAAEELGQKVFGVKASHYFADSGTPSRIDAIREDYSSGALERRGESLRSAVFIDRDGTMFENLGSARRELDESELTPELASNLAILNRFGIPVFLVTNQPGIAKGQITFSDVEAVHGRLRAILASKGAYLDDVIYCPHHPDIGFSGEVRELKIRCICRKPNSGMLESLAKRHGIELNTSWLIGDSSADEGAASKTGTGFIRASFDGGVGVRIDIALKKVLRMIGNDIDNN